MTVFQFVYTVLEAAFISSEENMSESDPDESQS